MTWYDSIAKGATGWNTTLPQLAEGPMKKHMETVYAEESERTLRAICKVGPHQDSIIACLRDKTWIMALTPPEIHVMAALKSEEMLISKIEKKQAPKRTVQRHEEDKSAPADPEKRRQEVKEARERIKKLQFDQSLVNEPTTAVKISHRGQGKKEQKSIGLGLSERVMAEIKISLEKARQSEIALAREEQNNKRLFGAEMISRRGRGQTRAADLVKRDLRG